LKLGAGKLDGIGKTGHGPPNRGGAFGELGLVFGGQLGRFLGLFLGFLGRLGREFGHLFVRDHFVGHARLRRGRQAFFGGLFRRAWLKFFRQEVEEYQEK
jgi:hypothetical protein